MFMKLLMPGVDQRVYNMQEKSICRAFSELIGVDEAELVASVTTTG